jgi:hypothetical protein
LKAPVDALFSSDLTAIGFDFVFLIICMNNGHFDGFVIPMNDDR